MAWLQRLGRGPRWSALPRLVTAAPPFVILALGVVLLVFGMLIVFRPLTSLLLLGVYVGASAVVSGLIDFISPTGTRRWWTRAIAMLWVVGGVVVLVWLGRSLELLPTALAILLMFGGVASLGDVIPGGRVSQRVLAACWAGSQLAFGVLALTWPDVTLLVVAVVFGIRTVAFAATLLLRGGKALLVAERSRRAEPHPEPQPSRATIVVGAVGRYALSLLLIAAAGGGWWLNEWLQDGAPVVDAFYWPPDDVPAGHGRLIRFDDYQSELPKNGTVNRILYTTRDALGSDAVASGLVIIPNDPPPGPRPVVIWNHGTTGVAQGCAPSLRDKSATKWSIPALEQALALGWVVIASDYSGQGAPGDFPYLIGRGEARSSLDAVLAAGELDSLILSPDTVVWGHSQGGHAALWTTMIAGEYTPGLRVLGTAAIAPAA